MSDIIVVGIASASRDIETWHFKSDDILLESFCQHLATETRMNAIVIEGKVLGTYAVSKPIVEYIEYDKRFEKIFKNHKLDEMHNKGIAVEESDTTQADKR